jgi:hypothetical protein
MSLDLDLCRNILIAVAAAGDAGGVSAEQVDGADRDAAQAQFQLLVDAGLAHGVDPTESDPQALAALTPAGREFLRLARNETLWARVKSELAGPGRFPDLKAVRARLLEWAQFSF